MLHLRCQSILHQSSSATVGTGEQEAVIDIQVDPAKAKQKELCYPIDFWLLMGSTYPTLARNAVRQQLVFRSTWECKQGFSAIMVIKSKSPNRLTEPGHDFRGAVSKVWTRIDQSSI